MPRDGSGTYTLPAGNPVVDGTIIDTGWANPTMSDIAVQLNNVLTRDGVLGPNLPFKFIAGSVAAPGATFAAAPSTGFYWPGAGQLGVTVVNTAIGTFQSTGWNGNVVGNITGNAVLPLGAVGAPSLSFSGDSNTGMWSPGADQIAFSTAGSQRFSLSAAGLATFSGDVTRTSANIGGINAITSANSDNTNGASHARFVASSTGAAGGDPYLVFDIAGIVDWSLGLDNSDSDQFKISTSGSLGTGDVLWLTTSGNMGLGGVPNAYGAGLIALTVNASSNPVIDLNVGGTRIGTWNASSTTVSFGSVTNAPVVFQQNGAERMRLSATNGNLLVARSADAGNLFFLQVGTIGGANRSAIYGSDQYSLQFVGAGNAGFYIGASTGSPADMIFSNGTAAERFRITDGSGAKTYNDGTTAMEDVGMRGIPRIASGGGTPGNRVNRGNCFALSAGLTVPANTFNTGDAFSIYNDTAGALTITQGASLTLRLHGTTTTGNRTLALRGFATVWFNSATEAIIMGDVT